LIIHLREGNLFHFMSHKCNTRTSDLIYSPIFSQVSTLSLRFGLSQAKFKLLHVAFSTG